MMNCEFSKKLLKLSEIVENRSSIGYSGASEPTNFSFIVVDGKLKCVWTKGISDELRKNAVLHTHINPKGLQSKEWNALTEQLWDYL